MEPPDRPALAHHDPWPARMGSRVLTNESWYNLTASR
jgi:hypothetical protein